MNTLTWMRSLAYATRHAHEQVVAITTNSAPLCFRLFFTNYYGFGFFTYLDIFVLLVPSCLSSSVIPLILYTLLVLHLSFNSYIFGRWALLEPILHEMITNILPVA